MSKRGGSSFRDLRIADLIRKLVAEIIGKEIKDPRLSLVTIIDAKLVKDPFSVVLYFSILEETPVAVDAALAGFRSAMGILRGRLATTVHLRYLPALRFVYDDSGVRAAKIARILDADKGISPAEQE